MLWHIEECRQKSAIQLERHHCIRILDSFEWEGILFIIQEYITGAVDLISAFPTLGPDLIPPIITQLIQAVAFLHSIDVVHLDLKLDNVLLVSGRHRPPQVKLIDFGLAENTSHSTIAESRGTYPYMTPEMYQLVLFEKFAAGKQNSVVEKKAQTISLFRQDTWALGILIYVLSTGNFPWIEPHPSDPLFRAFCRQGVCPPNPITLPGTDQLYKHFLPTLRLLLDSKTSNNNANNSTSHGFCGSTLKHWDVFSGPPVACFNA